MTIKFKPLSSALGAEVTGGVYSADGPRLS